METTSPTRALRSAVVVASLIFWAGTTGTASATPDLPSTASAPTGSSGGSASDLTDTFDPASPPSLSDLSALAGSLPGSDLLPGSSTTPPSTPGADAPAVPPGVGVTAVDDIDGATGHHKRLHITSAAMPAGETVNGAPRNEMLVDLVLPRDWYTDPAATFPTLWGLNGLYGSQNSSAWLQKDRGNAEEIFGDKNIMLVLPLGGEASFYTDWQQEDRGDDLKWETFLTAELPGVLARDWRANNWRGVMGVSMGATASVMLTERHPDLFRFAGSMSGFLDLSSPGMPPAMALLTSGYGRDVTNMWGPYYSRGWLEHDPKLHLDGLRNATLFVSAGSGVPYEGEGYGDPVTDEADKYSEVLARASAGMFLAQAYGAGLGPRIHTNLRTLGSHNWMPWRMDMEAAWPVIREALHVAD